MTVPIPAASKPILPFGIFSATGFLATSFLAAAPLGSFFETAVAFLGFFLVTAVVFLTTGFLATVVLVPLLVF